MSDIVCRNPAVFKQAALNVLSIDEKDVVSISQMKTPAPITTSTQPSNGEDNTQTESTNPPSNLPKSRVFSSPAPHKKGILHSPHAVITLIVGFLLHSDDESRSK